MKTIDLFNKYETKFEKAQPFGKPFVISAIEKETGTVLFENKTLYGHLKTSEKVRGVGHVFFANPDTGEQFIRWHATSTLKNAITNETTSIILIKVIAKEKKDPEGNQVKYYQIAEDAVTNEDGGKYL